MTNAVAHLGLGTNLGDRWENLRRALALLTEDRSVHLLRQSNVYETEPWGVADQPSFLNLVAEVATSLDPEQLLAKGKEVERELGRVPGRRWGPRLIDLDILLMGDEGVDLPHLQIPHPRLHLRAFALVPLAELIPDRRHPVLGHTIGEMSLAAEGREGVIKVGEIN